MSPLSPEAPHLIGSANHPWNYVAPMVPCASTPTSPTPSPTTPTLSFSPPKTLGPVDLPELPATTTILTTQNSVEMPHLAVEKYGPEHVIPGVVRSFLTRLAPGITCHDGNIQTLTFGSLHPATRDLAAQLAEILSKTPITPAIRDDILADVWAKALFVTTFGALGALMNQPIGVLRTTYRDSLRALITEAATWLRPTRWHCPQPLWPTPWRSSTSRTPPAPAPCNATLWPAIPTN